MRTTFVKNSPQTHLIPEEILSTHISYEVPPTVAIPLLHSQFLSGVYPMFNLSLLMDSPALALPTPEEVGMSTNILSDFARWN
jgi:hypothetical protein